MVPPWDHHHNADTAELYTSQLEEKRAWTAMTEMLEHYGASIEILPSETIDGAHDIWTRDPSIMINEGGTSVAYVTSEYAMGPLAEKAETMASYREYLENQGIEVREVDAEIEGGNILIDPEKDIILYTTNSTFSSINTNEMNDALQGFDMARDHIAEIAPDNLEIYDIWLDELKGSIERGNFEEFSSYIEMVQNQNIIIPEGLPIEVDGRTYESTAFYVTQNAYKYEQAYNITQSNLDQLNQQADLLQAATGIPVVPIARTDGDLYHLDTFASVITHEQTHESYLLIHPDGTNPDTMERLEQIYGDNIIELNDQDITDLGPNLVQSGNTLITNNFSPETRTTLETLGFEVRGQNDVGLAYNLSYDDNNVGAFNQYIGSGVHCLTDEAAGIEIEQNKQIDGLGTPFHAGM